MAEILAAITFPIAAYQTVKKFYEFGKLVHKMISEYEEAPTEVKKIREFVKDMYDGNLRKQVERTEWIFDQQDVSESTKTKASESLQKLKDELVNMDHNLTKSYDLKGRLNSSKYVRKYGPMLAKSLTSLSEWEDKFWAILARISTDRQLPDPLLLRSPQPLAPRAGKWNISFERGIPLKLGYAELAENRKIRDVVVLIEQVQTLGENEFQATLDEAKSIAMELAGKLQEPSRGILRCLGYRDSTAIELVFEIPKTHRKPHTMRHLLSHWRTGRDLNILAPLEYRFKLVKELSSGVYMVNAAEFVHKNIRPDSICRINRICKM